MCQWAQAVSIVNDRDAAEHAYVLLLPYRARFGVEGIGAGLHGSVEHHLGLLARALGRAEEAEEHFEAAIQANERIGGPLLAARSRRELASWLLERDASAETERAVELVARAAATYRGRGLDELAESTEALVASVTSSVPADNVFRSEGEFWTLSFGGSVVRMKDAKGLHDLARLLTSPGREIAVLDLVSERIGPARSTGEELHAPGHTGEVLDERARAEYKTRLAELEEEIEEADAFGDPLRSERARAERDALAHELATAYGLGGRPRRTGDPAERARTTVTRRIRDTIARIDAAHPSLGRHLRRSVRTGAFCVYEPEKAVDWTV
jgi:tetratricopeptide (TPR) repeat protein